MRCEGTHDLFSNQLMHAWYQRRNKEKGAQYLGNRDNSDRLLKELAKAVKATRLRSGMTQAELAKAVGASQGNIARLESGQHAPSVRVLQNIAAATHAHLTIEFKPRTRFERSFDMVQASRRSFIGGATGLFGFGRVRQVTAQEATAAADAIDDYMWTPPAYDPEPALFDILDRNDEIVIVDTVDGPVEIPANPQRIVTLAWEYIPLFELGISDPIVGIGYFDAYDSPLWNAGDLTETMHTALANATLVPSPSEPDIEQIATLNPDLILTSPQWPEDSSATLAQLAPTIKGKTHPPSVPRAGVRDFGAMLGRSEELENLIADHDAFIERARQAVAAVIAGKKAVAIQPTVDSFRAVPSYYTQNDEVFAHSYGAYQLHRELGITPSSVVEHLADDDREAFFLNMSMEQIRGIDADFIFVYDLNDGAYDAFASNTLVQLTVAGQNDQIYAFNGMSFGLGLAGIRAGIASIVETLTGKPFE